ncbi:hypothetical protein V5P93_005634 [Actinokineospora auranticolor]|uniref:Uncharacterized protein n=1 Tax=Actinokineospora auranticolor TaxID=155976 RepID=A0A2S6GEU6_9PSEU|nr:hypothetical protein [Actinokineospora auranticolor]PPK63765.1 hypothetical protein CLV40_1245 [Actinokineospora auranticolor]
MPVVRYNALAREALGDHIEVPLSPALRRRLREGVVHLGDTTVLTRHHGTAAPDPDDLTGWECSANSFHLEDHVPVEVRRTEHYEPRISEADQLTLLRQGLTFAIELTRLIHARPDPPPTRCVVSTNHTCGTFRLHRLRPHNPWLADDLDTYVEERLVVVDEAR